MHIGLVVNPFAGMGGAVGLKGTDGPDTVAEARRRGASEKAGARARLALAKLADRVPGAALTVAAGALGEEWVVGLNLQPKIVSIGNLTGTARDTRQVVAAMGNPEVIVFAGGDGTARDVAGVSKGAAILGIPCGVKMHSAVFAVTPQSAGAMMADLITSPERISWIDDAEVMDIDEDALRQGVLAPQLFGLARTPVSRGLMQAAKGGPRQNAAAALLSAAAELVAQMEIDTLYIIGPGSSASAVLQAAGQNATPLGVDAVLNGKVVAQDADHTTLERLAKGRSVKIILGVTGQQGFLLGRGNQQISPALIEQAGREGLIILATESKLTSLVRPRLLVDTGNPELDAALGGFVRVSTGANRQMLMRIASC